MTEKGKKEAGTSMVAPSPTGKEGLRPVEELATERGYQPWYLAGLRRAAGWAPGKQVTVAEFDGAVKRFERRPQGGGKI